MNVIELKQNKMSDQLTELQVSQKLFELNTNKKLARLQDGLDTVMLREAHTDVLDLTMFSH